MPKILRFIFTTIVVEFCLMALVSPVAAHQDDPRLPSVTDATYLACGGTSDTPALRAAILAGKPIVIPFGVTCATDDITISVPVYISYKGLLKPNTGKTATLTSAIWAGDTPWQAFANALDGQGTIRLPANVEAYPQWWGGDPTGVADSARAINAAERSGAKTINLQGNWGLASPIFLTTDGVVFDGKSRTRSNIYALSANISSGSSPNALLVCMINAWNGTMKSIRFPNHGVSYSGWIISAIEGGTRGEQAMFSGNFYDLWVDPGSLAAGFFTGGLYDSWFHHIQFESCRYRFLLTDGGGGADNVQISNINETACFFPMLQAVASRPYFSGIVIDDVTVARHQNDFWIKAKNIADLTVTNVKYQMNDDGSGQTAGFASFENSTGIQIENFTARRLTGTGFNGIKLVATHARISHGSLKGLIGTSPYGVRLEGLDNDVVLDDLRIEGPDTVSGIALDGSSGIGGNLRVANCEFTGSVQYVINLQGSISANFTANEILNGNYGVTTRVPLVYMSTSGMVVFSNNKLGVTDVKAVPTAAFDSRGSGAWYMSGNIVVGMSGATLLAAGSTQVPKLQSNWYVDRGNYYEWIRTGKASPLGSVTPAFLGETYLDNAAGKYYKAGGLTNADWKALN